METPADLTKLGYSRLRSVLDLHSKDHSFSLVRAEYGCYKQREGTGLLKCQAMPSLRLVAHDGWLCTFTI